MAGQPPIRTIIEIGTNVGNQTLEMLSYWPQANIWSYEPVEPYRTHAHNRLLAFSNVQVIKQAVTALHLYKDDLGEIVQDNPDLQIHFAVAGAGCEGGSRIQPAGKDFDPTYYRLENDPVSPISLDEACKDFAQIDYMKTDCEGSESSFLGCASEDTMNKIRFIGGEYHELPRFWNVVKNKLFKTHLVSLVGDANLGSFFAERRSDKETLLVKTPLLPVVHQHLQIAEPIWWNVFDAQYIPADQRWYHGI